MPKPGLRIEIPGFGELRIQRLVTDYSGTLSCGGKLAAGVQERLLRLDELLDVDVLTSDTFGTVRRELVNIPVGIKVLEGDRHDLQKEEFVTRDCEPRVVAALGNGANDARMLAAVREAGGVAIAVDNGEGCAVPALTSSSLFIRSAADALDLLLDADRLKAGLRF